jgi:hypothetical protein
MVEEPSLSPTRRLRATLAGFALLMLVVLPAAGQDPVRRDTLVEALPDSARGIFDGPTRAEPQQFPQRRYELRGGATEVFECDRDCLRSSTALSLLDLLTQFVPGIATLRAGYFAGPHHVFDGAYGAGFAALYVDGREEPSLERAQTDLSRLSLVYVERVRVFRDPAGIIIDVETYRHSGPAYSRIGGATGDPSLQSLEGAFANGLSDAFVINGGFQLMDVTSGGIENDRFEAMARLSWMPRSNDFGAQFEYRTETVDRSAADTAEVRRNSLLLRARANLGERAQLEVYGMRSAWKLKDGGASLVPPPASEEETEEELDARLSRGADVLSARLVTGLGAGSATIGGRLSGGGAYPSVVSDLAASHPWGGFAVEGGVELGSWTGFSTSAWRGGVAYSDSAFLPFTIRGFASAGDRGLSDPVLDTAHVVGFDAAGLGGDVALGPFELSGRYTDQSLDRPVTLAASWDRVAVFDSSSVDISTWEVRVAGPLIPLGGIISGLEPIRLRGFYRTNATSALRLPIYVPKSVLRAEVTLNDSFFDGNLELWFSAYVERKSERFVPVAGEGDLVTLPAYTWPGGQIVLKIGDFRFFYRFENPAGTLAADIPGADFPRTMGVFGIRWEFYN